MMRVCFMAREGAARLPRVWLDHAALREIPDLLLRVADGRQDLLVGLAELRRRAAQRKTLLAVRDRMAEDGELAEHRRAHRLRHLQVLHLRIGERLVDLVDRTAGYAGLVQE